MAAPVNSHFTIAQDGGLIHVAREATAQGFRNLLRRKHADEDIADEVDNFFAEAKAEFEARGLTADDAARTARIALGSSTALREEVRSYGWENILDGILTGP